MDEIVTIILVILGVALVLLIMPIVALVKAAGARREARELAEKVRELTLDLAIVKRRVAEGAPTPATAPAPAVQTAPTVAPATVTPPAAVVPPATVSVAPPSSRPTPAAPPPIPDEAFLPPPIPALSAEAPIRPQPAPPVAPFATPPLPPPPAEPAKPAFDWEQFVGVKLFAWLAGVGLLAAMGYFLKYSIDHGWVPPTVRAALGFVAGAGLLVGGLFSIRRQYAATGQSLVATGIVVLYAVTVACRLYYRFDFFQGPAAGALLLLITVAAFLLAVRLEAQVVAILGLLGGFLTPIMLSTGVDNPPGLFGFVALLDLGILAVALHRRWFYLAALAAAGTVTMQIGWADKFFELAKLPTAVVVLVGFNTLFTLAVAVGRRLGRSGDWLASAALLPPVVALGFTLYFSSLPAVAARAGWVLGNLLAADLALLAVCALHRPFAKLAVGAGLATFGVAAVWIASAVNDALLPWALGLVVVVAALHAVFPFVQERLEPGADRRRWSALFPPLALVLLLIPFAQMDEVGWWLWPAVLMLNLFALVAAALTRVLAALAASLLITLLVLGVAIAQLPANFGGGERELLLVAGFSLFFCAGAVWLVRRFGGSLAGSAPDWSAYLPDATAGLPFVLLLMLVFKLRLPDPSPIFGVVLLLLVLLYGIALVARRGAPVLAAFVGALLVEYTWKGANPVAWDAGMALVWYATFALGLLAAPFVFRRRVLDLQPFWAVAALALPLHFGLLHRCAVALWPELMRDAAGALAAVCVLPPLAGLVVLLRTLAADEPFRLNRLAWFGAATLFFITLIFPLQFNYQPQWLTISWALEGAALLWLYHRIPHPGLRLTGLALLTVVFVRLALNPAVLHYATRSPVPVFNWILGSYGVATACCFAGMRLLAPPRDRAIGLNAPAILAVFGTILAFALVNLEIADYFTPEGAWVRLEFSGDFARDIAYTIAWALFALVLIVVGMFRRLRAPRYAGIALLAVTYGKLFFHDMSRLETFYRMIVFLVVSVVTLAASFLFQRFLRNNPPTQS
ncbi:MAG: DUF2339 domain-containing protein [Opitutaceae bacterium]